MTRSYRIQGHSMNTYSGAEPQERDEAAPRQHARYHCERGCVFTVPLAEGARPRTGWDCRCGGVARLDGAPEGARPQDDLPGLNPPDGGHRKGDKAEGMDPWGQLMKRRTRKELEALLAERINTMRGGMSS